MAEYYISNFFSYLKMFTVSVAGVFLKIGFYKLFSKIALKLSLLKDVGKKWEIS